MAVVVAALAAALAGVARAGDASRTAVLLPLILVVALGMLVVAYRRFEMFLAAILILRASLDAAKLGGAGGGRSILDPAALLSLTFLFAAGIWLVVQYQTGRRQRAPIGLALSLIALTIAGGLSIATSRNSSGTAVDVLRLATVVALVLVLAQVLVNEGKIRFVLTAVYASAIVPLLFGIWQHYHGIGLRIGGFVRIYATFQHPNPFAIYLTLLAVMGIAIWGSVHGLHRIGLSVILAGIGVNLLFTYTRSAWIAAVMGVLVIGILQSKRLLALMWIGVIVIALAVPSAAARFQDLSTATRATGTAGNSLIWRVEYWKQALELGGNPITGIGLGAVSSVTNQAKEPHNDFIRSFVETGIIGLFAYIWMLLAMINLARRALRTAPEGFPRAVAAGFTGALASFMLLSVVSNVITQLVILLYFAAFATCAWAAGRLAYDTDLVPGLVPASSPARSRAARPRPTRSRREDPARQQVPLPARRRRRIHAGCRRPAGGGRARCRVFRDAPSREHPEPLRAVLPVTGRVRAPTRGRRGKGPWRLAAYVVHVGTKWDGVFDKGLQTRRRASTQHLPPALAIDPSASAAAADRRLDDAA